MQVHVVWKKEQWVEHEVMGVYWTKEDAIEACGSDMVFEDDGADARQGSVPLHAPRGKEGGRTRCTAVTVERGKGCCWFGKIHEHGGGQSYIDGCEVSVYEDRESAVQHMEDYFDEEHNRDEDPCEECGCDGCGEDCPCRQDMLNNLENQVSISVSYKEGATLRVWCLPVEPREKSPSACEEGERGTKRKSAEGETEEQAENRNQIPHVSKEEEKKGGKEGEEASEETQKKKHKVDDDQARGV